MNRVGITKNNKGAALVMVIIAMMFVGIIAAIALTITVGNSKSTKATIDTSENFYSSENILNDLEMYLKKLATSSATEAYAEVLTKLGTSTDIDAEFETLFANIIKGKLEGSDFAGKTTADVTDASHVLNLDLLQNVCFDRYGLTTNNDEYELNADSIPVKIKYERIDVDENGRIVLKNVVISLKQDGYESTITTDITFNAKMPKTGKIDTSDDFTYDIDHFVIISGNDIKANNYSGSPLFNRGNMNGEITGNIYAYNDFVIQTDNYIVTTDSEGNVTSKTPATKIKSNYIIVGNDIIVDKGTAAVDPGNKLGYINGAVSIEPINKERIISAVDTPYGANIWADDFKVYDGSVEVAGVPSTDMNINTYLGGNLELNGNKSEFLLTKGTGDFKGYSYKSVSNGMISSTFAPKSSSIILNGLGAKLDLEKLTNLNLSGTAYTSIADLQNVETQFSSYDDASANFNYYTQGESITYRALQALYLVPGDCIAKVGHNPMTIQDVLTATGKTGVDNLDLYGLDVTIPDSVKDYINTSNPYTAQYVRYVGNGGVSGEDKIYLFWNFTTKANAVAYFNKIITTDTLYFSGHDLSEKQIKMLNEKNGYIKLPASGNCSLYGNAVYYDGGLKTVSGKGTVSPGLDNDFGSLKSYASPSHADNGKSLLANMFPNNRLKDTSIIGTAQQEVSLMGPLTGRKEMITTTDGEGNETEELKDCTYTLNTTTHYKDSTGTTLTNQITYDTDYSSYYSARSYKLVTGANVKMTSFDANTTYIVVTPGDVEISNVNGVFRGMIIAGGNVSLGDGLDMECLGMISYTRTDTSGATKEVDTTEFRALLDVCVYNEAGEEDPTSTWGNFKLRQIFNVADTSATGGSGNGDDFVTILTSEWKRN